jgi:hypothetical protein
MIAISETAASKRLMLRSFKSLTMLRSVGREMILFRVSIMSGIPEWPGGRSGLRYRDVLREAADGPAADRGRHGEPVIALRGYAAVLGRDDLAELYLPGLAGQDFDSD